MRYIRSIKSESLTVGAGQLLEHRGPVRRLHEARDLKRQVASLDAHQLAALSQQLARPFAPTRQGRLVPQQREGLAVQFIGIAITQQATQSRVGYFYFGLFVAGRRGRDRMVEQTLTTL